MSGLTKKERKAIRQSEALERQKVWSNMTLQQQLNDLDSRLGKGVGAIKQRKRIQYAIDHPQIENQKKIILQFCKMTYSLHIFKY